MASLEAKQTRTYALSTSPGDYARGSIAGSGGDLVLIDASGVMERRLATRTSGRQDFMFVVGDAGPYRLEVHAPVAGDFVLTLDEIVPRAAQRAPAADIESPRLRALQRQLAQGRGSDVFWQEMRQRGTPLIEYADVLPALSADDALVTFLWRGAKHNVRLFAAPSGEHDELQRLGDSDVWYRSYRVPRSTRLGYQLAPDVPQLDAPADVRRRAVLATAQRDPLNPLSFPGAPVDKYLADSVLELPDAPPQSWHAPVPEALRGSVEAHRFSSRILGNTRDVWLYRPAGYRAGAQNNALLVVFDGDAYQDKTPTPTLLDNLIRAGKIPSTAAILIGNPDRDARSRELPPNPEFATFLADELMPWARAQGVHADARRTVVAGASFGGLAAAYVGLRHPELFGNVLSQSGSFWWSPPGEAPEWLTREYARAEVRQVRFVIEAGLFEGGREHSILDTSRHLRDVLQARDYAVTYREYAGGHDHLHWRVSLPDGLIELLGEGMRRPAN